MVRAALADNHTTICFFFCAGIAAGPARMRAAAGLGFGWLPHTAVCTLIAGLGPAVAAARTPGRQRRAGLGAGQPFLALSL